MSTPWIAAFVVLCVFVVALGLIVLGLLRQALPLIEKSHRLIDAATTRMRRFGLPAGSMVPGFTAETVAGEIFTERDLRGRPNVLLFLGSTCRGCAQLFNDLSQADVPELEARLIVVSDANDAQELAAAHTAGATVLVQRDGSIASVFESDRVPHAFVIDTNASVRISGSPDSWEAVGELLAAAEKGGERAASAPVAFSAPH